MTKYYQIPEEMRGYRQWIVWKYEESIEGKPTKVPYSVHTGFKASVTKPDDWAAFHEAVTATHNGVYDGIGFVLTENDPFAFIDLDTPKNVDAETFKGIQERQTKVFNSFQSYAELSPSGTGAHIIVKGAVPAGRKRSSIEVYSSARYMTMTGNRVNGHGEVIKDCDELLNILWSEMGAHKQYVEVNGNSPQTESDDEIIQRISKATNSEKALDYAREGNWMKYHASQSEADFGLIDIIAFFTQNREQIMRIFRKSALGARDKAMRDDYLNVMINRAFDKMLPPIDTDGLYNAFEEYMAAQRGAAFQRIEPKENVLIKDSGAEFALPPGLLGEIAKFIYNAAPNPVPEIALATAIALMSGICGQSYNVSNTGLNHYVIVVAGTGRGKDIIGNGINFILSEVAKSNPAAYDFLGPSKIASAQGLIQWMNKGSSCFVSVLNEIGKTLAAMSGPKAASHHIELTGTFLDLYGKSGKGVTWNGSAYSKSENNAKVIKSPAFSFIGESNPDSFYGAINEASISDGFIPRLTIFEYTGKVVERTDEPNIIPSESLTQGISVLMSAVAGLKMANAVNDVAFTDKALEMSKRLRSECIRHINTGQGGPVVELYNRVHLRALKLAALYAVGLNPHMPTIDEAAMAWAEKIVITNVTKILGRFERGDIGDNVDIKQIDDLSRIIREYYTMKEQPKAEAYRVSRRMFDEHIVPYSYLQKRAYSCASFKQDTRVTREQAFKRALTTLIDTGVIEDVSMTEKGKSFAMGRVKLYMVKDFYALKLK